MWADESVPSHLLVPCEPAPKAINEPALHLDMRCAPARAFCEVLRGRIAVSATLRPPSTKSNTRRRNSGGNLSLPYRPPSRLWRRDPVIRLHQTSGRPKSPAIPGRFSERLEHVRSTSKAAVDQDRDPTSDCGHDLGQSIDAREPVVLRSAAVIRDHDRVGSVLDAAIRILAGQDSLDHERS